MRATAVERALEGRWLERSEVEAAAAVAGRRLLASHRRHRVRVVSPGSRARAPLATAARRRLKGRAMSHVTLDFRLNGTHRTELIAGGRNAPVAASLPARHDFDQAGLPAGYLRDLHGDRRQRAPSRVHHARRHLRRSRHRDGGVAAGSRRPPSPAAGVHGPLRGPVRLLHHGHAHGRQGAAGR